MDVQILSNILDTPKNTEQIGTIIKPLSPGLYQVRDYHGRVSDARADTKWAIGDAVTLLLGRIIGRANPEKQLKIYQV